MPLTRPVTVWVVSVEPMEIQASLPVDPVLVIRNRRAAVVRRRVPGQHVTGRHLWLPPSDLWARPARTFSAHATTAAATAAAARLAKVGDHGGGSGGGGGGGVTVSVAVSKTQGRACLIARTFSLVILNSISMANGSSGAGLYSTFEPLMDHSEVIAQLYQLRVTHQEFPRLHQIGG